jgi:hypothetical protein
MRLAFGATYPSTDMKVPLPRVRLFGSIRRRRDSELVPSSFRVVRVCVFLPAQPGRLEPCYESRWTVAGEKAGRQMAMYSAPSGVEYCTHSPG